MNHLKSSTNNYTIQNNKIQHNTGAAVIKATTCLPTPCPPVVVPCAHPLPTGLQVFAAELPAKSVDLTADKAMAVADLSRSLGTLRWGWAGRAGLECREGGGPGALGASLCHRGVVYL